MSALTLKAFLAEDGALPAACAQLLEACGDGKDGVPAAVRPAMSGAVQQALEQVMDVPVGQVLEASWSKIAGLPEALALSKLNPGAVTLTPLIDHTVTSSHSPTIDLLLGGQRLCEVALEIRLSLNLKGVTLELRRGRIAGLTAGECSGEGVVSFQGAPLLKRKTRAIKLPGKLAFGGPDSAAA